jgi:hypothetical protein
MALALDPTCPEARRLAQEHDRRAVVADGLPGSRLLRVVNQQRNADYAEHSASCARCAAFMRRCPECKVDLGLEHHRFFCAENKGRWKLLLEPGPPPLAALLPEHPPANRPMAAAAATAGPTRGAHRPAAAARAASNPIMRSPPRPPAMPKPPPGPHDVLGVRPGATPAQVRQAYRELALQYHPDRVAYLAPEFREVAENKMRVINAAYQALSQ